MSKSLFKGQSEQNQPEIIGALKSKITNVHNLIAQTRQIIQPHFASIALNQDGIFQSIKINNYTNAKIKIDIIVPPQEQLSDVQLIQNYDSPIKKSLKLRQENQQYKQNLANEYSQTSQKKNYHLANTTNYNLERQTLKTKQIIYSRELKQKSFKKITPITLEQKSKEFNKELGSQSGNQQLKHDFKLNQIKQNNSNNFQYNNPCLQQLSAIKVYEQINIQDERLVDNIESNLNEALINDKSYTSSSIKQQNSHQAYDNRFDQNNVSSDIFQLSRSKDINQNQIGNSKLYFELTSQKKEQKINHQRLQYINQVKQNIKTQTKSPIVFDYHQNSQLYETPIIQKNFQTKKALFKNQTEKSQKLTYIKETQKYNFKIQFQTPILQQKSKQIQFSTLDSKQNITNQKYKQNQKVSSIILPESKRLRKYSQLQKYRRIRMKTQQSFQSPKKQAKIVKINLIDKKAEYLFQRHKKQFLQRLKKNQKHNYGIHYNLNSNKRYQNQQSTQIQMKKKRSLSPRCQQVTQRLYNSRIGAYPCSFYEKFHQQIQRERFQRMVKQYPTATKYLSQKQRTEFYLFLKKQQVPQIHWMNKLLQFTNRKINMCLKR